MFKKILNLILRGAKFSTWQTEIGAYLLKQGCGYQIGQIVDEKYLRDGIWRVKVITGIFYDVKENKINHTAENRIIRNKIRPKKVTGPEKEPAIKYSGRK